MHSLRLIGKVLYFSLFYLLLLFDTARLLFLKYIIETCFINLKINKIFHSIKKLIVSWKKQAHLTQFCLSGVNMRRKAAESIEDNLSFTERMCAQKNIT